MAIHYFAYSLYISPISTRYNLFNPLKDEERPGSELAAGTAAAMAAASMLLRVDMRIGDCHKTWELWQHWNVNLEVERQFRRETQYSITVQLYSRDLQTVLNFSFG